MNYKFKISEYNFALLIIAFLIQFKLGDQEAIFVSKIILNKDSYTGDNPYLLSILKQDFSLLHFFSYFITQITNFKFANFLLNYLLTLLSFFSIYYYALLITKDKISSFLTVIFLISYNFINTRFYGIEFPTGFYTYGQTGMYFAFLSCALYLNNQKNLFSIFFVSLFFIHAAWFLFCVFFLLIKKIIDKNASLINFKISLLATVVIICFIGIVFNLFLGPSGFEINFFDTTQTKVHLDHEKQNLKNINFFFETHKPHFFYNDKLQIFNVIRFVSFDILFILTFFCFKKDFSKEILFIFQIFLILIILSYLYLVLDKSLLNFLPNSFKSFIDRLILTRYLNLINIFLICFYVSNFFNYLINCRMKILIPLLFISKFFIINFFAHEKYFVEYFKYGNYLSFYDLLIYLSIILMFFLKLSQKNFTVRKNYSIIFLILLNIFWYNMNSIVKSITEKKIIEKSIEKIGTKERIVLGGKVFGILDILSLPNENEIILMMNPRFHHYSKKEYSDLYCNNEGLVFKNQSIYFDYLNSKCLNKSKEEWEKLSKKMNIGYIILPLNVKSNLKLLSKTSKFKIYRTTDLLETK